MVIPKDFIETVEGLVFAVVEARPEQGRVLCFLRYLRQQGGWRKLATESANRLLSESYPDYLYFSQRLQAAVHAVPETNIIRHHQPRQRLQQLLELSSLDELEASVRDFCGLLHQQGIDLTQVGVTGSILIGAHNPASDIDLVFYRRDLFHRARHVVRDLQRQGLCQTLNHEDWHEAWQRRDCELSLAEYIDAEQRKYNKVIFRQRKIDLGLMAEDAPEVATDFVKQGPVRVKARIKEDDYAFDYPAVYTLEHVEISQIVCFTATFHGQAQRGEWVEVAGQLEMSANGEQRIIVGSSREARGEYIRRLES